MKWSIKLACVEFGVAAETIRKGIRLQGLDTGIGKKFTTKQIFNAITTDDKTERALKTKEERLALEAERKIRDRELVDLRELDSLMARAGYQAIRNALLSAHTELDVRCNPTDPALARREIKAWVDETLSKLREKLEDE